VTCPVNVAGRAPRWADCLRPAPSAAGRGGNPSTHCRHLARSILNRFAWFRRKRDLHFVHHRRVHSNYAIVEFWIDRLLGIYRAA